MVRQDGNIFTRAWRLMQLDSPRTVRKDIQWTKTGFGEYLNEELAPNVSIEIQLTVLSFCVGIQDAVCYPDFAAFASNQTGNTVMLAVGLVGYRSHFFHLGNIAVSLSMFLGAAFITGQLGNKVGGRRRWWQLLQALTQTLMVMGVAWLLYVKGVQADSAWGRAAVVLLAYSSGAQVAAARHFKMTEISTAMATAAWVDLLIDPALFFKNNRKRNRRVAFIVALTIGAFAGAGLRQRRSSALGILISGTVKTLVMPMLLMARPEVQRKPSLGPGSRSSSDNSIEDNKVEPSPC